MEIFRALGRLIEPPSPSAGRLAALLELGPLPEEAGYTQIFALELVPYASVYLGPEGMLGGEARDRIAGFWRALGEDPPPEPDHLAVMLSLYARLGELEAEALEARDPIATGRARRAFLWEHLLSFLPAFIAKLDELTTPERGFYFRWSQLLAASLREEVERLGPPPRLPLHLRAAPPLPDPRSEGPDAFVRGLLSPVRSGFLLARADLRRAGEELGLGVRAGERRYTLEWLLAQEAAATLGWLAAEASRWPPLHETGFAPAAEVGGFWAGRAGAAAALLGSLQLEAETGSPLPPA